MLTREELTTFMHLEYKIQDVANHVASIVKEWDPDLGIDENNTWWEVEANDEKDLSKGYHVHGCESGFDAELLCKTDEELHEYVEYRKEQHRLWVAAREKEKQLEEERCARERKERYERFSKMSRSELLRYLNVPEELVKQVELEEGKIKKIRTINDDDGFIPDTEVWESDSVTLDYSGVSTKLTINNTEA